MMGFSEAYSAVRDFMELGGDVLWAILLTLFLMWTVIFERLWFLFKIHPQRKKEVLQQWASRSETRSWYARKIRAALISETAVSLKQNIGLIKVLIAICPLLGLLGTVTGMITVFEVMAYSGTGNARAMAGGVSQATIPTMAGMVAALSGVYFGVWLEHRAQTETEKLGDLLQHH
jgi:biopolymer transport protein ExbB